LVVPGVYPTQKNFQTQTYKLQILKMFGQDTMWGDSGPMDCDGGAHDDDWQPYYMQPSYNDRIGFYPDLEDSFVPEYPHYESLEEELEAIHIFRWQTKIDRVHRELMGN